jgi:hypothetical protein
MSGNVGRVYWLAPAILTFGLTVAAQGAALSVAGSPGFDSATNGGFKEGSGRGVNNAGVAVGYAYKYVDGVDKGRRAVRWDSTGSASELDYIGDGINYSSSEANDINDAGIAVGAASKYVDGQLMGDCAVRWVASDTAAIELGSIAGETNSGSSACAVNDAGVAVGYSGKHSAGGSYVGHRAVRWDGSGAATELGNLGGPGSDQADAVAVAVNESGTAVGNALKYITGVNKGKRAVRWSASGTAVTELGNLGLDADRRTSSEALAINGAGTAVGYCSKIDGGVNHGWRAVRWSAAGTTATELGVLGVSANGGSQSQAWAVNSAGTAVGYCQKIVDGKGLGCRAVRWDASDTNATQLAELGTGASGESTAYAYEVNDAGTVVGTSYRYVNGIFCGWSAVVWLSDASVIDLNDLGITPVEVGGQWRLTSALAFSSDGWAAGNGIFDPDGSGPLSYYERHWVAQIGLGGRWTKAAGGTWGRGPNWSTGTPAMQVGGAVFDLNSPYAVSLDRNESTKTIAINAGSVTIDLGAYSLSIESDLTIAANACFAVTGTPVTVNVGGDLENNGTLEIGWGTSVVIAGNLTGSGNTVVAGTMTASSIEQDALTINSNSAVACVPELGVLSLLLSGFGGAIAHVGWKRRRDARSPKPNA